MTKFGLSSFQHQQQVVEGSAGIRFSCMNYTSAQKSIGIESSLPRRQSLAELRRRLSRQAMIGTGKKAFDSSNYVDDLNSVVRTKEEEEKSNIDSS